MKNLAILMVLLVTACGGAPFSSAEFDAIGGDANESGTDSGSAGAPQGGFPVVVGGYPAAGAATGEPTAGVGGSSAAGAGGGTAIAGSGGTPSACDLNPDQVTAALSATFAWQKFSIAEGNVCAHCTYEPCGAMAVDWGTPTRLGDHLAYKPIFTRSTAVQMLVQVTKNDGACSGGVQCELSLESVSVGFSMWSDGKSWIADDVSVAVVFANNTCMNGIGKPEELMGPLAKDLQSEIRASLIGLKLPCN